MQHEHSPSATRQPAWTSRFATLSLWTVVVLLAAVGIVLLTVDANLGGILLIAALILAAPAGAASRDRTYV